MDATGTECWCNVGFSSYVTLALFVLSYVGASGMALKKRMDRVAFCKSTTQRRIVGIGLSRTGSSSFSHALALLGFSSWHFTPVSPKVMFETYGFNCVADLPFYRMDFTEADIEPGVLYVYTDRNPEEWAGSMTKWSMLNWGWDIHNPNLGLPFINPKYVELFKSIFCSPKSGKEAPVPKKKGASSSNFFYHLLAVVLKKVDDAFARLAVNVIGSCPWSHINMRVHNIQFEYSDIYKGKIPEIITEHRERLVKVFENHKDQLVIINCTKKGLTDRERWETICNPIGIPVPDIPFPNEHYQDVYFHQWKKLYYTAS